MPAEAWAKDTPNDPNLLLLGSCRAKDMKRPPSRPTAMQVSCASASLLQHSGGPLQKCTMRPRMSPLKKDNLDAATSKALTRPFGPLAPLKLPRVCSNSRPSVWRNTSCKCDVCTGSGAQPTGTGTTTSSERTRLSHALMRRCCKLCALHTN
eukprot:5993449-Alexandrium_andersonii.AAC.1